MAQKLCGLELKFSHVLDAYYSEWLKVPEDRNTIIKEIMEGKKFQIRTDKKIDGNSDIRWTLGGVGDLVLAVNSINVNGCVKFPFQGTEPFLQKAGEFGFLKTSTQLKIWFDNVPEVTWTFKNANTNLCDMKKTLVGLSFKSTNGNPDTVSTYYKYQIGQICDEIACRCFLNLALCEPFNMYTKLSSIF